MNYSKDILVRDTGREIAAMGGQLGTAVTGAISESLGYFTRDVRRKLRDKGTLQLAAPIVGFCALAVLAFFVCKDYSD